MRLALALVLLGPAAFTQQGVASTATAPFPNFESGPVRPLLLAPDGAELYVLNTADARVEVFRTGPGRGELAYDGAIFTGLEPVAMALHPDDPQRLFVANLLSDSVTVVDLGGRRVLATIAVGDEPLDVAVAGGRLFVSTARSAAAPDLIEPGIFVDNAVVVASAESPYAIEARLVLPAHRPRALAVVGDTVYVVPQNSGNHTTLLKLPDAQSLGLDQGVADAFDAPFELNPALVAPELSQGGFNNNPFGENGWVVPAASRIVLDHEYPGLTPALPDHDLFAIDALTLSWTPVASGVGTTLFALERNPATGELWVTNTDAKNRTRFEPNVRGQGFSNQVSTVDPATGAVQRLELAHAQPVALAFLPGKAAKAYVAAHGTATVVVLDAFTGATLDELAVGELPLGLAVDAGRKLLYVFTRGDKAVRAYDIARGHAPVGRPARLSYDPEPAALAEGRVHLYDARVETGAGNGNMSCASCHVFGHGDQLGWDLGDPGGGLGYFYPDLLTGVLSFDGAKAAAKTTTMTHPLKGPMVTQSLRGLSDGVAQPLHWRGDRRFFQMFRGAFRGLLGGDGLSPRAMQEFAAFTRTLTYPPNPLQAKDRQYTGDAAFGRDLYGLTPGVNGKEYNPLVPGSVSCADCHTGDFAGESNFTGSQLTVNFDGEPGLVNAAQLRGGYEKEYRELTGFGVLHDGTFDGVRDFLDAELGGMVAFPALSATEKDAIAEFVRRWDTGLAPLVGQQRTATAADMDLLYEWLDLAEAQAQPPLSDVDLVGKASLHLGGGALLEVGLVLAHDPATDEYRYLTDTGRWVDRPEIVGAISAGLADLHFTVVPPGLGTRLGVDRDEDGLFDGLEAGFGTNPGSPDTDRDGFDDLLELTAGGHPLVADASLPGDTAAPAVTATPLDVFTTTATLHLVLSEPARLLVELGTAADVFDLPLVDVAALRRVHDVVLDGLPAGGTLHWRVTATDQNGNAGATTGSFATAPPLYHVAEIALAKEGDGPYTVTGTVLVVDQDGAPVVDVPVRAIWAGDIGGADFFPAERTDAAGVATFVLGPYTPAAPTSVTLSPAYAGSNTTSDAFFIGEGGNAPAFFYEQAANEVNWRSIAVP